MGKFFEDDEQDLQNIEEVGELAAGKIENSNDFGVAPEEKDEGKSKGKKFASFDITVDGKSLAAGFNAPFSISFEITDDPSRKNLTEIAVEAVKLVTTQYPDTKGDESPVRKLRRWLCRNLNLSDRIFDDPETFAQEMRKVQDNADSLVNIKPEVVNMHLDRVVVQDDIEKVPTLMHRVKEAQTESETANPDSDEGDLKQAESKRKER